MEEKSTVWPVGIRTGILVALVLIIFSMIIQFTGMSTNTLISSFSNVFYILGIIWAHKTFKETGDGFMTYGQGLGLGVIVSGVAGVISVFFTYLYIKLIDDSMLGKMLEQARVDMEQKGIDDDQIEQGLAVTQKFMTAEMILMMGILGAIFMGFIFSLIISAITKKKNPALEF